MALSLMARRAEKAEAALEACRATPVAEICAAMTLGRLSFCVAHDVNTLRGGAAGALDFYLNAVNAHGATAIGFVFAPVCAIDLVRRRAWRALGAMLFFLPFAVYLGTDALHFLRTFDGVAPGDYYETYVAVARSFAFSHAVEALAATAVLVLLRSDLAEERRPKRA